MNPETKSFFTELGRLLKPFETSIPQNDYRQSMELFLLSKGLKCGVLLDKEDILVQDFGDFDETFTKPLKKLMKVDIVVHLVSKKQEYYDGERVDHTSIWVLTSTICNQLNLNLRDNEDPDCSLRWQLLDYTSDYPHELVKHRVSVYLHPKKDFLRLLEGGDIDEKVNDWEITCLCFLIDNSTYSAKQDEIIQRLQGICQTLAQEKIGQVYYEVEHMERSEYYSGGN